VLSIIDMIDSAGFHGIATDMATATEVPPRLAGTMANLLVCAEATHWPVALDEEVRQFTGDLTALQAALEAGNLEASRLASEAIHGSQHDLSKAVYRWLGGRYGGTTASATAIAGTLAVIDMIDSAGFHGIATDMATATEIPARLGGKMTNLVLAALATQWPAAVSTDAAAFIADVGALADALEAADLEDSRLASEAVHGSQHDLSKAVYQWLGGVSGGSLGIEALDTASTLAIIDMVNSAGFHGIATDMATATEVPARLGGNMSKLLAATKAAVWPAAVSADLAVFIADLGALADALEAADLEDSRLASEAVHGSQHDLSKAVIAALGGEAPAQAPAQVAAPSTGNAGMLAESGTSPWLALVMGALAVALLAGGRAATGSLAGRGGYGRPEDAPVTK
jgi:hypothetical protein